MNLPLQKLYGLNEKLFEFEIQAKKDAKIQAKKDPKSKLRRGLKSKQRRILKSKHLCKRVSEGPLC